MEVGAVDTLKRSDRLRLLDIGKYERCEEVKCEDSFAREVHPKNLQKAVGTVQSMR